MGAIAGSIGGIGGILGGVGALTSALGPKPDYGSAGDLSAGRGYLGAAGGVANQYGQRASDAFGQYGADNGAYRSAVGDYAKFLGTDPYTDQYSTAKLAQATAGGADAYQRARANLQASAAGAGLGGGLGSGVMGGMAGIDAAQAGQIAGSQNAIAMQAIQQHRQNLGQLTDLYGGMAGTDYSRGYGALGAQAGLDQSLGGQYLGMGDQERSLEISQQQGMNQAFGGALGDLGSIFGSKAGYGATGGGYGGSGYAAPPVTGGGLGSGIYTGTQPSGPFTFSPVTYQR